MICNARIEFEDAGPFSTIRSAEKTSRLASSEDTGLRRMRERLWARTVSGRPLKTTYTFNLAGQMRHLDYSDNTPDVTFSHDEHGRVASRQDGSGTTTFSFAGTGSAVVDETRNDGTKLHRGVDGFGREASYWWWDGQRFATWGGWGYDAATGKLNGANTARAG
jgi:hypothetical protein